MTAAGLAATDIFLSATAALLLILAIAAPDPPRIVPIQADILAVCDATTSPPLIKVRDARKAGNENITSLTLKNGNDLVRLPEALQLAPRLQYTIALMPDISRSLPMTCVSFLRNTIVRPHNASLAEPEGRGPVYTLSVAFESQKKDDR